MSNKIKFKLNQSSIALFIEKLDDLSKIHDTIKLKIDSEHVLMYAMLGGSVLLAFKNFTIDTGRLLDKTDFDYKIDLIIPNAKKFVKNLQFVKDNENITLEVQCKPSPDDENLLLARSFQIVSGKFKVNWLGGESYDVRDIDKTMLSQRLDLKNKKWSFKISNTDFSDIKKLSNINSERILNINISNGLVNISEKSAWELEIDQVEDDRNTSLILNKRFLSCINDNGQDINIHIFDTFMLIKDVESNLMLSFEQDFSDD
jgi:hypothetical protein